jgi:hypothetical protein
MARTGAPEPRADDARRAADATPLAAVPGMPGRGPGMGRGHLPFGPKVRPRDARRTVRRILAYFAGEGRRLAVVAVLVAFEAALGMAGP